MIVSIGHIFTHGIIEELQARGFSFFNANSASESYLSFCCPLMDSSGQSTYFEIRQVFDEEIYLNQRHAKNFEPFETTGSLSLPPLLNSNTVTNFSRALHKNDLMDNNIAQYFQIRKYTSLWALHLQCKNFEEFKRKSKPDRFFKFNNQEAGLIHLNPSCYDLLITAL